MRHTESTKFISSGFPAKWLIFTAIMLLPTFCQGQYCALSPLYNKCVKYIIIRKLSINLVVQHPKFTWTLLHEYNYKNMNNLQLKGLEACKFCTKFCSVSTTDQEKYFDKNMEQASKSDKHGPTNEGLDDDGLVIDFSPTITHIVDTSTSGNIVAITQESHAAPAVSIEAGLELFESRDIEINLADKRVSPVIFDTGASLVIPGDQADFLPNTLKPISSLKVGGMAAGASITGVGNVAWIFPCDNGDQLAIITKCYLVPNASSRLLSPQRIFDKQNGYPGKYWGDEDQFHLEYHNKPIISVQYSPDSNLPIIYAISTSEESPSQVNLTLVSEENQNLTGGQKLLLEYHYRCGHTNMPLIQQILRS